MRRPRLPFKAALSPLLLLIASLLLIHTPRMGVTVSAQVGADKRPTSTPTPKKSTPPKSMPSARTTRRSSTRTTSGNDGADNAAADERTFWESIKDSTDPEDFRAYLKQYPNGKFVALAKNRLKILEGTNSATNSKLPNPNSSEPGPTNPGSPKATPQPPGCMPAPSGMVSWYAAENNANDIFGPNDGALQGSATFAAGKVGQAFSFNGINQYVTVPDNANMQPTALTIAVWVNFSTLSRGAMLASKYDGNWHGWLLQSFDKGNFMFQIERTTNVQSAASGSAGPIAPHTWVHVAGTYDGTNITLYINGSVVGTATFAGGYTPTSTPMTIGKASWYEGNFLSGQIDELEFFNRALLPSEIRAIVNAGNKGNCHISRSDATNTNSTSQIRQHQVRRASHASAPIKLELSSCALTAERGTARQEINFV